MIVMKTSDETRLDAPKCVHPCKRVSTLVFDEHMWTGTIMKTRLSWVEYPFPKGTHQFAQICNRNLFIYVHSGSFSSW